MLDLEYFPLSSRLFILLVFLVLAVVLPRFLIFPDMTRHGVGLREYVAAYRTARWFGWEPGPVLRLLASVAIAAGGVYHAFPEFFGG